MKTSPVISLPLQYISNRQIVHGTCCPPRELRRTGGCGGSGGLEAAGWRRGLGSSGGFWNFGGMEAASQQSWQTLSMENSPDWTQIMPCLFWSRIRGLPTECLASQKIWKYVWCGYGLRTGQFLRSGGQRKALSTMLGFGKTQKHHAKTFCLHF